MSKEPPISYEFITSPKKRQVNWVNRCLRNYNFEQIGKFKRYDVLVLARDKIKIIGGVYGGVQLGWLYIHSFFIRKDSRKKGVGTKLMAILEEQMRKDNIRHLRLNTADFQEGLDFYKALGFEIFAKLPIPKEHSPNHKKYYDYYLKKEI